MFVRNISDNEMLYTDLQDLTNTYAIQFLFTMKKVDLEKLEEALNFVLRMQPGVNVYLKGKKYYKVKTEFEIKKIIVDIDNILDINYFKESVDYKTHSLEVAYIENTSDDKKYIVFKILHSVLDGAAALVFIQNIMNYLKGTKFNLTISDYTDLRFVKEHDYYKKSIIKAPDYKLKNAHKISAYDVIWDYVEIPGVPKLTIAKLSKVFEKYSENKCRIMIPSDIRRYEPDKYYDTNLTMPIFLDVKRADSIGDINSDLWTQIKEHKDLNIANAKYLNYVNNPKFIRKAILGTILKSAKNKNVFSVSALVSLLGKVDVEAINNEYFEMEDFVSLPIHQPLCPISMVVSYTNNTTKIGIAYYKEQFTKEDILNIKKDIFLATMPDLYSFNNTKNNFNNEHFLDIIYDNLNEQNPAIEYQGNVYTYEDLRMLVVKANAFIEENSIEDKVIIYSERTPFYVAFILACIFNKVTFIPVDISKPLSELEKIIEESKCHKIVIDKDIKPEDISKKFDKHNLYVFNVLELPNYDASEIEYLIDKDQIIYNIYTSGTTSTPKCVPITMENLNNYLLWALNYYGRDQINMPFFTSISVDLTVTSIFLPLLTSGFIKIYNDTFSKTLLSDMLQDEELNFIKATPTHLSLIDETFGPKAFIIGGEALSHNLCTNIFEKSSKARIFNEYGPTETTVGSICKEVLETDTEISIGVPISNTKVLLLSDNGEIITKQDEPGEILINSLSTFSGYANAKTQFYYFNNERYYKTGDLAIIKNKELFYIGRIDNQIKINGNRIELDRLKNAVLEIPEVKNAVVEFDEHIILHVSPKLNENDIRKYIAATLEPVYMPHKIVFDDIMQSGGGKAKVEENVVEAKEQSNNDKILDILSDFIDVEEIDENEPIYCLGLDSMDALTFVESLSKIYSDPEHEKEFSKSILKEMSNLSLADLRKKLG